MSLQDVLRTFVGILDKAEDYQRSGETDPRKFFEAVTGVDIGQSPDAQDRSDSWWELFGLDEKPETSAQLDAAWRSWAARNHPDRGGSAPAFRYARNLYETQRVKLR